MITARLAYVEGLADQRGPTCAAFLERTVTWFGARHITSRRVMSDNGSGYVSRAFRAACAARTLRHLRIACTRAAVQACCRSVEVFGHGPRSPARDRTGTTAGPTAPRGPGSPSQFEVWTSMWHRILPVYLMKGISAETIPDPEFVELGNPPLLTGHLRDLALEHTDVVPSGQWLQLQSLKSHEPLAVRIDRVGRHHDGSVTPGNAGR